MKYAIDMNSCVMIFIQSFMKIDAGVQALLRFGFSNLRGCSFGITEEKDL
jgi:hypothetical protein